MKPSELRELTPEELDSELHRLCEELFSLRFQHKTQRASNPLKLRTLRRDIARTLTIIHEKKTLLSRQTRDTGSEGVLGKGKAPQK